MRRRPSRVRRLAATRARTATERPTAQARVLGKWYAFVGRFPYTVILATAVLAGALLVWCAVTYARQVP